MTRAAFYKGNHSFSCTDVTPKAPAAGEVAIDIAYCGICGTDLHIYHGDMDGRTGDSRIIGHEMSGRVSALGAGVEGFKVGEPVVVRPLVHCGECPACKAGYQHICHKLKFLGIDRDGAMQSVWCVPAFTVHHLPKGISLRNAALIEPIAVACHDVRRSALKAGERVLIIGGGPIGVLIGLVAQKAGGDVTICEINPARRAKAQQMGLAVVDPAAVDVVKSFQEKWGGANVVFEVSGSDAGAALMTAVAATRGRLVMVGINNRKPPVDLFLFFWRELELIGARVYEKQDYEQAIRFVADGAFDFDAFVTDVMDLSEIQDAFSKMDSSPELDENPYPRRRRPMSILDLFSLKGRTALVTGAKRGIGFAMAKGLAEAGADIVGVSASLEPTGSEIEGVVKAAGRKFTGYQCDLSDRDALHELLGKIKGGSPIDILVNNAGTIRRAPAAEHGDDFWDLVIETNLTAPFVLAREIGTQMLARGRGKIIFTASLLSFQGGITVPGYAASKGGIAQLVMALSNEWASKGINVNGIAPGYIATDNTKALREDPVRSKAILDRIPAGRWGNASDLAGTTVFLASGASDYMNGHIVVVDGGWMGR